MANRRRKKKQNKVKKFSAIMQAKMNLCTIAFLGLFALLVGRILWINLKDGKKYEQRVLTQQSYSSSIIPYRRGDILDSNGTTLATTEKVYNMILEPKNILEKETNRDITVRALKDYFSMTQEEIDDALSNPDSFYYVARKKLNYETVKKFKDYRSTDEGSKIRGVYFEEEYKRIYPNDNLACHLLGFKWQRWNVWC